MQLGVGAGVFIESLLLDQVFFLLFVFHYFSPNAIQGVYCDHCTEVSIRKGTNSQNYAESYPEVPGVGWLEVRWVFIIVRHLVLVALAAHTCHPLITRLAIHEAPKRSQIEK